MQQNELLQLALIGLGIVKACKHQSKVNNEKSKAIFKCKKSMFIGKLQREGFDHHVIGKLPKYDIGA